MPLQAHHLVLIGEPHPDLTVIRFKVVTGDYGWGPDGPRIARVDIDESDSITITAYLPDRQRRDGFIPDVAISLPVTVALTTPLGFRAILDGSCDPPVPVLRHGERREPCQPTPQQVASAHTVGQWTDLDPGPLAVRGEPKWVWRGDELFIVGGLAIERYAAYSDGAAYNPSDDTWRRIAPRPAGGRIFAAAPTDDGLLALGLTHGIGVDPITGGHLYNAHDDAWRPVASLPEPLTAPQLFWTGSEVLLWETGRGLRYNSQADEWFPLAPNDGVFDSGRAQWIGQRLAVQTARTDTNENVLSLYDPSADAWTNVPLPQPEPVSFWNTAHGSWTGSALVLPTSGERLLLYKNGAWTRFDAPLMHIVEAVDAGAERFVCRSSDESHTPVLVLIDPTAGVWYRSEPRPDAPHGVMTRVGDSVFLWGRPSRGGPEPMNTAYMWTPPPPD